MKFSSTFSRRKRLDSAAAPRAVAPDAAVEEAGLEDALHVLWPPLRAYVTSLLGGDPSSVDDTLQETALHVWQHKHELPEIRHFRAWVFRIAYVKALSCYRDRKASRMVAFEPDVMERIADAAEAALFDHGDDRIDVLTDCVSHLNADDRDLLALHYERGHTLTDLAEKLGKQADALHQRVSRLRRRLRRCMENKLPPFSSPSPA